MHNAEGCTGRPVVDTAAGLGTAPLMLVAAAHTPLDTRPAVVALDHLPRYREGTDCTFVARGIALGLRTAPVAHCSAAAVHKAGSNCGSFDSVAGYSSPPAGTTSLRGSSSHTPVCSAPMRLITLAHSTKARQSCLQADVEHSAQPHEVFRPCLRPMYLTSHCKLLPPDLLSEYL